MNKRSVSLRSWGLRQRHYLYDLIFPVFILMFFPPVILLTLGGNYILDAAVICIVLSANSVQLGKKKWKLIPGRRAPLKTNIFLVKILSSRKTKKTCKTLVCDEGMHVNRYTRYWSRRPFLVNSLASEEPES